MTMELGSRNPWLIDSFIYLKVTTAPGIADSSHRVKVAIQGSRSIGQAGGLAYLSKTRNPLA